MYLLPKLFAFGSSHNALHVKKTIWQEVHTFFLSAENRYIEINEKALEASTEILAHFILIYLFIEPILRLSSSPHRLMNLKFTKFETRSFMVSNLMSFETVKF